MWMLVYAGVVLPSTPHDLVFRQVGPRTIVSQLYLHILLLCLVVPFPTVFLHVPIVVAKKTLRSSLCIACWQVPSRL